MSVRNSIFRTAERAMPPKTATIGFQMPRPLNFSPVIPPGASKSSDSMETFGRSPLPRTTSFPFTTPKCSFLTAPSTASASIVVFGEPCTSSAYFGIVGTLPGVQIRLDVELAVLDERAQPIERCLRVGSRGRARVPAGR